MSSEVEILLTIVPPNWDVTPTADLVAPCGDVIGQDGACSCGEHVSPLHLLGFI